MVSVCWDACLHSMCQLLQFVSLILFLPFENVAVISVVGVQSSVLRWPNYGWSNNISWHVCLRINTSVHAFRCSVDVMVILTYGATPSSVMLCCVMSVLCVECAVCCCRYAAGDRAMEESDSNGSSSVYQSSSSSSASSSSSIASDDTVRIHGDIVLIVHT